MLQGCRVPFDRFSLSIIFVQIEHVVKRMEERKQGDLDVFKWFKVHVIESKLEPSIEHQELVSDSNTD